MSKDHRVVLRGEAWCTAERVVPGQVGRQTLPPAETQRGHRRRWRKAMIWLRDGRRYRRLSW